MFRRHFFLIIAVLVIAVMAVAATLKIVTRKSAGAPGAPAAGAPGGPGGPGAAGGARPGGPGGPGGFGGAGGRGAQTVGVAVVRPRMFTDRLEVLGVAKGRQSVTLTSNTAEMVDRVLFRPGQAVRQGQVLIELRRQEEDAGIDQAKANAELARVTAERWTTLAKQGVAPQATADQYQAAYLTAKATLAAAQSREADRVIRAPFSGMVGLSDIAPGALISPGTAIVTLDDLSVIRVDFDVPDRYIALIHQGGPIQATTDAYPGERYAGRISQLDTRIDERSRSFKARAELPNPGNRLKPGMLIRVGIDRGSRMGLAAPESAVQFSGGQSYVFVLTPAQNRQGGAPGAGPNGAGAPGAANTGGAPKGQGGAPGAPGAPGGQGRGGGMMFMASQRQVLTGLNDCGFIEIRQGLEAGDRIVSEGVNVQPNSMVRAAPPAGMTGRRGGAGGAPGAPQGQPGQTPAAAGPGPGAPAAGKRPEGAPGAMAGRGPGAGRGGAGVGGAGMGGRGPAGGSPGAACGNRGVSASAAIGGAGGQGGQGAFGGRGRPGGMPGAAPGAGAPVSPGSFGGGRPGMARGAAVAQ